VKTFPHIRRGAFGNGLIAVALAVGAPGTHANAGGLGAPALGTVTGRVVDAFSTLPISGATVTIGNIVSIISVADKGGFVIRNVPVGAREVRIAAAGWQRYATLVTVRENQTSDIGVIGLPSALNR